MEDKLNCIYRLTMLFQAAYRSNTLGLPKICPETSLNKIDSNILLSYLKSHHNLSRMVVAGVGVDHQVLVEYVTKYTNTCTFN